MAALQLCSGSYRLLFPYLGKQFTCTLGDIDEAEAFQWKARCEQLLMRIKQGLLDVPRGVAIADVILFDGKPPVDPSIEEHKQTTLHELREA